MCTVIYLPATNGPLFSSCRDEDPSRPASLPPAVYKRTNTKAVFSKDGSAGGTWAGMNETASVVILLNGAFENHERKKFYRKSRGLIVKDLLFEPDAMLGWHSCYLQNIEPFTLVIWNHNKLYECIWDGSNKCSRLCDSTLPHIWSSATLYGEDVKNIRSQWFNTGLQHSPIADVASLRHFLWNHTDPENGFIMKRNDRLATLSLSFFQVSGNQVTMHYHDLVNKQEQKVTLFTKSPALP